ncbi:hypothetical protein CR513_16494, partial [Mucuna pruriens]
MMQRTLDCMQIRENMMDNFDMQLIQCNERKLIGCFWISTISQETLGLVSLQFLACSTSDLQLASLVVHEAQHTKSCPSIVLKDIKHVLYVKKTHPTINRHMKERHVTLGSFNV